MLLKSLFVLLLLTVFFPGYGQMEVMTYNIKYANENDGENSWSFRKEYLRNQLGYYEPDILGVQEALLEQLDYLKSGLKDHDYIGEGRDAGTKGEYSAIFYNTLKFEVLRKGTFWLSATPGKISKGWDAAFPRICTYAKFKTIDTGKEFWVFNTHFDHIGEKARKKSSRLITSKIQELNTEGLPVILTGDFNLEPETKEIAFLSKKFHDSKTSSNLTFGPEGTFNGYHFMKPVTQRIDYIFTSKGDFDILKYAVLSDSKNMKYPSDHFPVMVHLKLK